MSIISSLTNGWIRFQTATEVFGELRPPTSRCQRGCHFAGSFFSVLLPSLGLVLALTLVRALVSPLVLLLALVVALLLAIALVMIAIASRHARNSFSH